jgi:hypothetical protein
MPDVYVEARPKAVREGRSWTSWSRIHADHVPSRRRKRQSTEAGRRIIHLWLPRVRHLSDKKIPDHWRAAQPSRN